ncbi:hypothetical protein B0H14DRAFT_3463771 [Mycena olivaceomarginata]|nr:hypothetical protein B0H14DRAFT_3463771 [Mycena olivaceomarginata]
MASGLSWDGSTAIKSPSSSSSSSTSSTIKFTTFAGSSSILQVLWFVTLEFSKKSTLATKHEDDEPTLSNALLAGAAVATQYINKALIGDYILLGAVLHPAARITFFKGNQWDPSIAVRARRLLLDIVKRCAKADRDTSPSSVAAVSGSDSSNTTKSSVFAMAMALKAAPAVKTVSTTIDGKDEVELYCGNISPVSETFDDPLTWWKENVGTLKYMARIARDILAIPGVSISVERLFSSLKHTLSDARSSMTAETAFSYVPNSGWQDDFFAQIGLDDLVESGYRPIGAGRRRRGGCSLWGSLLRDYRRICGVAGDGGGARYTEEGKLSDVVPSLEESRHRLAAVSGTSTCHLVQSPKGVFVNGVWGPYKDPVFRGWWMNEGGQSSTGQLIDFILTPHPAYPELQERAKAQGKNIFVVLGDLLEKLRATEGVATLTQLLKDVHMYPDFHGNRSPIADPRPRRTSPRSESLSDGGASGSCGSKARREEGRVGVRIDAALHSSGSAGGDAGTGGGEEGAGDDIIRCICGSSTDDGFSIVCNGCGRWCHCACFANVKDCVPNKWWCWKCRPGDHLDLPSNGYAAPPLPAAPSKSRRRASISGKRPATTVPADASPPLPNGGNAHIDDLEDERTQYAHIVPHAYAAQWCGVSALEPTPPTHTLGHGHGHTLFVFSEAPPTPHPTLLHPSFPSSNSAAAAYSALPPHSLLVVPACRMLPTPTYLTNIK